jgi:uncharacterized protein (TIGR02145 family)
MPYTPGDRLKFTGISGNYSTVMTDIPASDKTIIFNFILCKDGDNNNYPIVVIGTQTWMEENLKTTKYNDGISIPIVTDNTEWMGLTTPAYCWYNNDIGNKNIYGALYNWHTVATEKLCPLGWHVSSDVEWAALRDFLGLPTTDAGGKLKETGTSHWGSPNLGATNETGFTALPGGWRYHVNGLFYDLNKIGNWWTSFQTPPVSIFWYVQYVNPILIRSGYSYKMGYSVRCMKDSGYGLTMQNTIPAAGGNAKGSGGSASFTVGQIFYTKLSGTNGSVVQGIQQPHEISMPNGK